MRPFISRSTRALLAVLVALAASPLVSISAAAAAPAAVSAGALDWGISSHVETSASLNGARGAGAPTTDDGSQWHFTDGTGSYDPATGALDLSLPGRDLRLISPPAVDESLRCESDRLIQTALDDGCPSLSISS